MLGEDGSGHDRFKTMLDLFPCFRTAGEFSNKRPKRKEKNSGRESSFFCQSASAGGGGAGARREQPCPGCDRPISRSDQRESCGNCRANFHVTCAEEQFSTGKCVYCISSQGSKFHLIVHVIAFGSLTYRPFLPPLPFTSSRAVTPLIARCPRNARHPDSNPRKPRPRRAK